MILGDYCALLIALLEDRDQQTRVKSVAARLCSNSATRRTIRGVKAFTQVGGNATLFWVDAGHHIEGIDAFANEIRVPYKGQSLLRGVELKSETAVSKEQEGRIEVFTFKTNSILEFDGFSSFQTLPGVVHACVSPLDYSAMVLCNVSASSAFLEGVMHTTQEHTPSIFEPVWVVYGGVESSRKGRRAKYDAIWAQLNEALISSVNSFERRLDQLESKCIERVALESSQNLDFRLPISTFRKYLHVLVDSASQQLDHLAHSHLSKTGPIDVIARYTEDAERAIGALEGLVQQRLCRKEERRSETDTDNHIGAITALDGVAHQCGRVLECSSTAERSAFRNWVVLLGNETKLIGVPEFSGVLPVDFSWIAPGAHLSLTITQDRVAAPSAHPIGIVEFPRRWALRCGAYPLIALAMSCDIARTHWTDDAVVELRSEVEREISRLRRNTRASFPVDISTRELAGVVFHDFISISMMGPAYVYALARFGMLGRIGALDWHGLAQHTGTISEELVRFRLNLRLLKSLGVTIPFFTRAFADVKSGVSPHLRALHELLEKQAPSVQERYSFAVNTVLPELTSGKVVTWAPDLALNALWYGVATRASFVNEAAVFLSLAHWGATRPEPDMPSR